MAETTIINNLCQILEEFDHLKQHPEFDKIASFLQGKQDITLIDAESSVVQAIAMKGDRQCTSLAIPESVN